MLLGMSRCLAQQACASAVPPADFIQIGERRAPEGIGRVGISALEQQEIHHASIVVVDSGPESCFPDHIALINLGTEGEQHRREHDVVRINSNMHRRGFGRSQIRIGSGLQQHIGNEKQAALLLPVHPLVAGECAGEGRQPVPVFAVDRVGLGQSRNEIHLAEMDGIV